MCRSPVISGTSRGREVSEPFDRRGVGPEAPIAETIGAVAALVRQGKARRIRVSETAAGSLRRAQATHPRAALESDDSLRPREVEVDLLASCPGPGIGCEACSPPGRRLPTVAHGAREAQIALARVLSRGEDIVPIPGTKRPERLEENIRALEITLAPDELDLLERTFRPGVTAGERYPPGQLARVGL